jgi:hypothetical protein
MSRDKDERSLIEINAVGLDLKRVLLALGGLFESLSSSAGVDGRSAVCISDCTIMGNSRRVKAKKGSKK